MSTNQTEINVANVPLSTALHSLESKLNRPIVDETDLDGKYDFVVK